MGMDVAWPYKKRELGDTITYTCPSQTLTWEEHLKHQLVKCIWHRQTDSMIWWPPELHNCNRKTMLHKIHSIISEYFQRLIDILSKRTHLERY